MASRFFQSAGPFAPLVPRPVRATFQPTANPALNMVVGLNPRPQPKHYPTVSATIAGRPSIGCCSECAAEKRQS